MNLLIVQRRLTHYRVPFFERLKESLSQDDINLTLVVRKPNPKEIKNYIINDLHHSVTEFKAEGGYSDSNFVNKSQDISTNADTSNADYVQFISALMQVKDLLQKLYDEGITAEMTDSEQNGKLFKKAIKKFETIENRASGK